MPASSRMDPAEPQAFPSIEELVDRKCKLPYRFPPGTERVQLEAHSDPAVAELAAGVTPLCDGDVEVLLADFLSVKQEHGTGPEKELYAKMTVAELFTRLLLRRPLGFWGGSDRHVLATTHDEKGKLLSNQRGGFESIGTEEETAPLTIRNYLSYDEMALAAVLSVAVPTRFISTGDRNLLRAAETEEGACAVGEAGSFVREGIIVGCVGARLVKSGRMEAAHVLVGPDRTAENVKCLGHWARFYGEESFPLLDEVEKEQPPNPRFHALQVRCAHKACESQAPATWSVDGQKWCEACMSWFYGGDAGFYACGEKAWPAERLRKTYLDTKLYKVRIRRSVAPFLAFASKHGAASGGAHVRVKGLGLGVWQVDPVQEYLMKKVYQELLDTEAYPGISVLEFAWFASEGLPQHESIKIFASKAAFADPVQAGCALVTMYCWDGNAYPGNEWWGGNKAMTDDSAAASCSLIASLQHPEINSERLCASAAQVLDAEQRVLRPFCT